MRSLLSLEALWLLPRPSPPAPSHLSLAAVPRSWSWIPQRFLDVLVFRCSQCLFEGLWVKTLLEPDGSGGKKTIPSPGWSSSCGADVLQVGRGGSKGVLSMVQV